MMTTPDRAQRLLDYCDLWRRFWESKPPPLQDFASAIAELLQQGAVKDAEIARLEAAWRCFHCDEVFTDKAEAQEHFGEYPDDSPLCLIKGEDGGLAARIRTLEAELMDAYGQRNEYENDARLWREAEADRRRRIGNCQWWQELDSREGERLVLAERAETAEQAYGALLGRIRSLVDDQNQMHFTRVDVLRLLDSVRATAPTDGGHQ